MGTTLASQIWLVIYRSKSSLQLSQYSVIPADYLRRIIIESPGSEVVPEYYYIMSMHGCIMLLMIMTVTITYPLMLLCRRN
ncbi:hypothetical protein HAX54_025611, partial [Datura stramonium]|nr:hypothetical protein [Datura stramonium]